MHYLENSDSFIGDKPVSIKDCCQVGRDKVAVLLRDSNAKNHLSCIQIWNFLTDSTLKIDLPSPEDIGFQKVYKNLNSSRLSITCLKLTKLIILRHAYTGIG